MKASVDSTEELRADQQREDRIFYKTAFALVVTIAIAFARQRWWL
jgi:hypothetical protein